MPVRGKTRRVRQGEHGLEYVVAWADETWHGQDIVITHVDVDNLLRAKAAIYAGYTVLAERVGVPLESVERFLIGGSFGKYINVEKAVQIGLLPDHAVGAIPVPGQHLGEGRVSGPVESQRTRAHHADRRRA